MTNIVVLITVSAIILAALCIGNAVAVHLGRLRARRAADAAVERLNDHYRDALREMHRNQ